VATARRCKKLECDAGAVCYIRAVSNENPLFEAVIVPHRSLSRRGLMILLGVIALVCTVNATVFVLIGAWPVGGFTGVELVLAAVLLRLNATSARASEMLLLTSSALRIIRTDPKGRRVEQVLAPAWLTVTLEDRPGRVPGLWLNVRGRRIEIGGSLGETEKRDLAKALDDALYRWRNPRFENPQLAD
jgi:uncharacterized membrane protein